VAIKPKTLSYQRLFYEARKPTKKLNKGFAP